MSSFCDLWDNIFLYLLRTKPAPHFPDSACLSVCLRLEFVHLLRSVVCTRGLPSSCLSRVSGCTSSFCLRCISMKAPLKPRSVRYHQLISDQKRDQFKTLLQSHIQGWKKRKKSDCEMLKIITQTQQPFWDGLN